MSLPRQIYNCKYRVQNGDVVSCQVCSTSAKEAMRKVLLAHPLAEFVETPTETSQEQLGYDKKTRFGRWGVIILLLSFLVAIGASMLVMVVSHFRVDESIHSSAKSEKTVNNDAGANQPAYALAYENLVSINAGNTIGSGFKMKVGGRVYLYSCLHCIMDEKSIIAYDASGNKLELGELELCDERDLVRFELPYESNGFVMAKGDELNVGREIVAYGDTLGGGVMTQNHGKVLAVGNARIEVDAAVLQGNSGGPVLTSAGHVLGVISSGSIDTTIWSKDTRYEKARRFAERIDNGEWRCVDYDELRDAYSFLFDTYTMTLELREFVAKIAGRMFTDNIFRAFANDQLYKGNYGYAEEIKKIYDTWNKMYDADIIRNRIGEEILANSRNGKPFSMIDLNRWNEANKGFNNLLRQSIVTIPLEILTFASEEMRHIEEPCFDKAKLLLIDDIEKVLIPAFKNYNILVDREEKDAAERYQNIYKLYLNSDV